MSVVQVMPYPAAGGGEAGPGPDGVLVYAASDVEMSAVGAIPFDWESYDTGGWHSISSNNSRLVVPPGVSLARPTFATEQRFGQSLIGLRKNGAIYAETAAESGLDSAAGQYNNIVGGIVAVAAGDYFEAYNEASNAFTAMARKTWFAAEPIGSATQYALLGKSATQAVSSDAAIAWDTEIADVGEWYSATSPSRLTVPAGVARVRVTFAVRTTGESILSAILYLTKNGGKFRGEGRHAIGYNGVNYLSGNSAVVEVVAGDYFELRLNVSSATAIAAGDGVWMCIEEVPDHARALVYKTSGQTHVSNTLDAVAFGGEVYDTESIHDTVTNNSRLTVPAGCTEARLSFGLNCSEPGDLQGRVFRNGDTTAVVPGCPVRECNNPFINRISALGAWIPTNPGDYFELYFAAASGTLPDDPATWFCGEFR